VNARETVPLRDPLVEAECVKAREVVALLEPLRELLCDWLWLWL